MTKQDRTTLKSFFRSGALPSAEDYRDLIDSSVNLVDDGFSKTDKDGLRLFSVGSSLRVLSLYQGLGTPTPNWVVEHGKAAGALHVRPDQGKAALLIDPDKATSTASAKAPAAPKAESSAPPDPSALGLSMTHDGRVGVNRPAPDWRLDVGGVVRMDGRLGAPSHKIPHIKANGKWQPITHSITGCQMFEVVAGVAGAVGKGRYSMLHAIAMNAYHPRNPLLNWLFQRRAIRTQTAVYGSFADRLRLKWEADPDKQHHYRLMLRSNADFTEDGGKYIRYYITRLWHDHLMTGARTGDDPDKDTL